MHNNNATGRIGRYVQDQSFAVVLGSMPGGLAVIRQLGKYGVPVVHIGTDTRDFGLRSKYCLSFRINPDDIVSLLILIGRTFSQKKALFCDRDAYMDLVYANEQILNYYAIPAPDSHDGYLSLTNKNNLNSLCLLNGIPTPRNWNPDNEVIPCPCLLKPIDSYGFARKYGIKALHCSNSTELQAAYNKYINDGFTTFAQELIPGCPESLFSVTIYRSKTGVVLPGYVGYKIRQSPPDFGTASLFQSTERPQLLESSKILMEAASYYGIGNFEYKFDSTTEQYKLLEVNGRPPLVTGLTALTNPLFLKAIFTDLIAAEIPPAALDLKTEGCWMYFLKDLPVLIKDRSWKDLAFWNKKIKWAVWEANDPLPMLAFLRFFCGELFNRLLRRRKRG